MRTFPLRVSRGGDTAAAGGVRQIMLTERIDAALEALAACRSRLPDLRDVFRPGAPERAVLDDLLAAMARADAVILPASTRSEEPR
jgi:hypothetical protein